MNINEKIKVQVIGIILPLLILILWQYVVSAGYVSHHILPLPGKVISKFVRLFTEEKLWLHIAVSLQRVFYGFFIGTVSGFLFGLLMGLSRTSEKIFGPFFHTVRQVPLIGWIPLIVMWFGMNELPRILIVAIGAFYPTTMNTFAGVRSVPRQYIELASVYGFKGIKLIRRIILPSALPSIVTGFTLSIGMSWVVLVAAELLIETNVGIGKLIDVGRETFNMELVTVGIITSGLLGFIMTKIVEKLASGTQKGRASDQKQ
jgi:sulfonate transport system permease protein